MSATVNRKGWFHDLRGEPLPSLQRGFNRLSNEEWCFFLSKRFRAYLRLARPARPPARRQIIFDIAWGWREDDSGTVSGGFIHGFLLE